VIAAVVSRADEASVCIGNELLSIAKWRELDKNIYASKDRLLFFIDDMHLHHDNIDMEIMEWGKPEAVIFASRHSSASKKRTLSVHPVGNFGAAEFGGRKREIVPSSPHLMLGALKLLHEKSGEMNYDVCYEVTHHGPYLSTPAFFIETGSTEREWNDKEACRVIAETIMEMGEAGGATAVGVGGGHYAPRFTDIALKRGIAFGHMIADYRLPEVDGEMVRKAIRATSGTEYAYFHGKKGLKYKKIFEDEGIECIVK